FHKKYPAGTILQLSNPTTRSASNLQVLGPLLGKELDQDLAIQLSEFAFLELGGTLEKPFIYLEAKEIGKTEITSLYRSLHQNANTFEKGYMSPLDEKEFDSPSQKYYAQHRDLPKGSVVLIERPGRKNRNTSSTNNRDPLAQLSGNTNNNQNPFGPSNSTRIDPLSQLNNSLNNPNSQLVKRNWVIVEIIGQLKGKDLKKDEVIRVSKAAWDLIHREDDPSPMPITLSYFDN
ncbi:MAG: hypothetical protein AAFU64_08080, partial [Bacteroidota bacterium]